MERRTAVGILVGSFVASVALFAGAWWLAREGGPKPPPPAAPTGPETFADLEPAKAWARHLERRAAAGAPAEKLPYVQEREIRDGLLLWTPKRNEDHLAMARFLHLLGRDEEAVERLAQLGTDVTPLGREAAVLELDLRVRRRDLAGAHRVLLRLASLPPGEPFSTRPLFDEAIAQARAAVEVPDVDVGHASSALDIAAAAAPADDAASAHALERARTYVGLTADPVAWKAHRPPGSPPAEAAAVWVFSDHFSLDLRLRELLDRWGQRVPIRLVARLTGRVREGTTAHPTTPLGESRRFGKDAKDWSLSLVGDQVQDGPAERGLGLLGPGAFVFVVDRDGRLVARAAGNPVDARALAHFVEQVAAAK